MEDSKLIDEIQNKTHSIKCAVSQINCVIQTLRKTRKRMIKEWDELVLLKCKVRNLEMKVKQLGEKDETTIP